MVYVLQQVEAGIHESARLWSDGARSLTAAFRIQQDHINNVYDILDDYRKTIRSVQYEFMESHKWLANSYLQHNKVLSNALYLLSKNTIQLMDIEALYNGIQSFMTGSNSHYVLPHDYIAGTLIQVQQHLPTNQPHMTLSRMYYAFYYNELAFRSGILIHFT